MPVRKILPSPYRYKVENCSIRVHREVPWVRARYSAGCVPRYQLAHAAWNQEVDQVGHSASRSAEIDTPVGQSALQTSTNALQRRDRDKCTSKKIKQVRLTTEVLRQVRNQCAVDFFKYQLWVVQWSVFNFGIFSIFLGFGIRKDF